QDRGTLSLWVFALEDLATAPRHEHMRMSNPHAQVYPLLSDAENPADWESACFSMVWRPDWHPSLIAKFHEGKDSFHNPQKMYLQANHFAFTRNVWNQFT